MKKPITILCAALLVSALHAQTNIISLSGTNATPALTSTNVDAPEFGKYDLTFDSSGTHQGGRNDVGLDVSLSSNPFEKVPDLWLGVSQSLYWQPTLAGSTDVDAEWNVHVWKNLYFLGAWSVGDVYGGGQPNLIRTGPEGIAQYYFTDNLYLLGQVNYDLATQQSGNWDIAGGRGGIRWSIGFGVEF